jgi:hypothetical protein
MVQAWREEESRVPVSGVNPWMTSNRRQWHPSRDNEIYLGRLYPDGVGLRAAHHSSFHTSLIYPQAEPSRADGALKPVPLLLELPISYTSEYVSL